MFRNGDRILLCRGYDAVAHEAYYRPLGGGIEFGEASRDALAREVREELGVEIAQPVYLGAIENIFTLEGAPGHEIVLIYDARFVDPSLYERATLARIDQPPDSALVVEWRSINDVRDGLIRLAPEGLKSFLAQLKRL